MALLKNTETLSSNKNDYQVEENEDEYEDDVTGETLVAREPVIRTKSNDTIVRQSR